MLKNFIIKIYFQVVVILLISIFGMGVGSAKLKYSIVEPSARFSEEIQFVATVSGTSVSFDWSAMVEANSYTMAVALSDANGDIDMGSLALLDMGIQKTFSTSGLPSGVFFYTAILADTDQGLVVSNTAEFMPFAGTVTFPMDGAVLMQIDDPGGIGTITVSGTVNAAEDTMTISQISGDTGFGPFVLTVVDDRPKTYTQGDLTMTFTYAADGTVEVQSVRNNVRSVDLLSPCQQIVSDKINTLTAHFRADLRPLSYIFQLLMLSANSVNDNEELFQKLVRLSQIYKSAAEGRRDKFFEDKAKLDEAYEACSEGPDPESMVDTSCSIPRWAERHEFYYTDGSPSTLWYTLDGNNVGPYKFWSKLENGSLYLANQSCRNVDGQLNGWSIWYNIVNGKRMIAIHYENGVANGHRYDFYIDGSLVNDITMVNGIETYRLQYVPDGRLYMYCDCAGDGIKHFIRLD